MTIELAKTLTDIKSLILDWNAGMIHSEEEFFTRLRGLNCRLTQALANQKIDIIEITEKTS